MPVSPTVPAREKRICPLSMGAVIDRIITFVEAFADVEYYTYQILFARRNIEMLLDRDEKHKECTALWARQCGKTECLANLSVGLAIILPALAKEFPDDHRFQRFRRGFLVGIYAPIDDQALNMFSRLRERLYSERAEEILADPEIDVQIVTSRGDTVSFSNGSRILARTASEQTKTEGKTHHWVICEEAQGLSRAKVEKELSPMLASTNGLMTKIGTAGMSRGGFHVSIQQNEAIWANGGKRNHFLIPYDIVIKEKRHAFERTGNDAHLDYERYIESQIFKLGGIDSDEFKMNFRCLWMESRVIAVKQAIFDEARLFDMEAGPRRFGIQVAGLDIGKSNDSTVLTVMDVDMSNPIRNPHYLPGADEDKQNYYMKTINDWVELGGPFETDVGQYARLVEYLAQTRVKVLCVDATSMGNPVFERIQVLLGDDIVCVPYIYSVVSKAALYRYYLQELHARRILYASGPDTEQRHTYMKFRQQHRDLDRVVHGGYVVCEAPEGEHDDYPDSAALAAWAEKVAESVLMPDIQVDSWSPKSGLSGPREGQSLEQVESTAGGGRLHRMDRYRRRSR